MSKESYARGFAKKASESGVDAIKLAQYATPITDTALQIPGEAILHNVPGVHLISPIATLVGLASDEDNSQKDMWKSLIPGVGAYRMGNRLKTQIKREQRDIDNNSKYQGASPLSHAISEALGTGTSSLAMAGIGAGLGALASNDKKKGTTIGALTGAGVSAAAILAASIAAAIKRRRTKEEQIEHDKGSILKNLLIPGVGTYNSYKRMGRSQGERDEDKNNKNDNKKTNKQEKEACHMSKESYARGFAKQAASSGVDAVALANFVKNAFSFDEIANAARRAWDKIPESDRALAGTLLGAGGGAAGGALLGGLTGFGAGKGAFTGASLGGVGGSLLGARSANRAHEKSIKNLVEGHRKEIGSKNSELVRLLGDYDKVVNERDVGLSDLKKLRKVLSGYQVENEGWGNRVSQLMNENSGLKGQLKDLAEQLRKAQDETINASGEASDLRKQLNRMGS